MTKGDTFFYVALSLILLSGAYSLYLAVMLDRALKLIEKQKQEIARLVLPPFQGAGFFAQNFHQDSFTIHLRFPPDFPRFNVGGQVYNKTMKKRKPPLNKIAQATRNAHSAELFRSLMLNKHLVITPTERKGSRQANKRKAISESL